MKLFDKIGMKQLGKDIFHFEKPTTASGRAALSWLGRLKGDYGTKWVENGLKPGAKVAWGSIQGAIQDGIDNNVGHGHFGDVSPTHVVGLDGVNPEAFAQFGADYLIDMHIG